MVRSMTVEMIFRHRQADGLEQTINLDNVCEVDEVERSGVRVLQISTFDGDFCQRKCQTGASPFWAIGDFR